MQVTQQRVPIKSSNAHQKMQRNIQLPNALMPPPITSKQPPIPKQQIYEIISQMLFQFRGITSFRKLLSGQEEKQLLSKLEELGFQNIDDPLFLFDVDLQPENIQWTIWKHSSELNQFLKSMDHEIEMMQKYPKRMTATGGRIVSMHSLFSPSENWDARKMPIFQEYLNFILNHPFLRKSVSTLTFAEHCMPIQYWHIKTYQQGAIFKEKGYIRSAWNSEPEVEYYLTVTKDGILRSTKNLLQAKIQRMVPFTNQFTFESQINADQNLVFNIGSCIHENLQVNFKKDYIRGINFQLSVINALRDSNYLTPNRFESFAVARQNCSAKLYNDGQFYFEDLCNELNRARNQVLITDWWITPYFLLKRPDNINHTHNRLDGILKRCGDRGVKIFIIIFRQPVNFLCNDSYDAQIYLESLTRNLRVRRHPIVPQKWSHHEKSVIIDQKVGFMGGLDICYGRWDTSDHFITNVNDYWNGADYTNERKRGFTPGTTKIFTESPVDRETQPRMPWHDIGIQLRGDAVVDLARHFIQYWYFVDAEKVKDPYNHLRNLQKRFDRASTYEVPAWQAEEYDQGKRQRTLTESIGLFGTRTKLFFTGTERRLPDLLITAESGRKKGDMQLQICRSASTWSIGARETEHSIHNAYQTLIKQSQNLIYIENQFFMGTNNLIVSCMAQRIERAYHNKQNLKIVVVMPLLPGFDGEITEKTSGPLRIQVHNQFDLINRGKKSLYSRLCHLPGFNINDYVFFFGLRGHAKLKGQPVTEIIYVHSKLMIVDDKRAIIGSANINDRSLLGDRDSELAIVIEQDNGFVVGDRKPRRKQIFNLRQRLFNEHFGLTAEQSANINSPQVWNKIIKNAKNNTLIYRRIFGCYPDDTITVTDQVEERQKQAEPHLYDKLTPQIVGHAVEFPLQFMKDEDMEFQFGDKQSLAGPEMFL